MARPVSWMTRRVACAMAPMRWSNAPGLLSAFNVAYIMQLKLEVIAKLTS